MKTRTLLSVLALGFILSASGQKPTMELTFSAENNGQYIPLDSILIENLTQGGDTTLYAPDTVLVLDYVSGIGNNKKISENNFSVSQNYPNPFNEKTVFNLNLKDRDAITITVRDVSGREIAHYQKTLNRGNHSFAFYSAKEKLCILTVTGKQTSRSIKMISINRNKLYLGKCKIVYIDNMENNIGLKSEISNNGFVFDKGDELKFTAYTDVEEAEMTETPTGNHVYTFLFEGWTPCPEKSTITDIDGNVYNTVLIGSQCWMKENLKTTTYNNGIPIQNLTDSSSWNNYYTSGYVWYNNNILWKDLYGALYNWNAANDTNGFCPTGWHLPTHDEWTMLTDFIGGTIAPHGNELKSCKQVNSPLGGYCNTSEQPRWDEGSTDWGTDDYGFSCLPGGFRDIYGGFIHIGTDGLWWTATVAGVSARHRGLYFNGGEVYISTWAKRNGFSVRCLRDK